MSRRPIARDPVRVTIRGVNPERVLSACADRGIRLSDITPVEDYCVTVTVSAFQVGKIRSIASKYQCEVEKTKISRAGRLLRGGKRRAVLAALVAVACLLAWLSSLFVWEIRVSGNQRVSTAQILRALEDSGFTVGTFWPRMNIDLVRSGVQRRVHALEWFTVNLHGSVADVIVTERVDPPEVIDNDVPYELYAAHSGIVVEMEVLQGQPLVQRGDFVTAGQVLVSGAPEDIQGDRRGIHALGSVRVRTAYCLTAQTPLTVQTTQPDGRARTRYALLIGKKRVNFMKSSSIPGTLCDKLYAVSVCAIPGLVRLPVALVRETVTPLRCADAKAQEKAERARLERALLGDLQARIGEDGEVITKTFTESKSGGVLTLTLRCECEQEIALSRPCEIPNFPTEEGNTND